MQGSTSKLRNVFGEASKEKFEDVKANETSTEGSLIDANAHFIAVSWSTSGGGCVGVFDAMTPSRIKNDTALIRGHSGPVLDVKFSPFRPNLLATASEDSTVRLWEVPQGGVTEDGLVEIQKFTGHSKKVGILAFSPTVTELIASASFDNTVNVWNICNGTSYSKVHLGDGILSLDWNSNGSLLGVTTKLKTVNVIDPRANVVQMQTNAHESGKTQKMGFLDSNFLFTCGVGKSSDRQIKLFDMRKFTESVQTVQVDTQNGIMMPFYDQDTGLLYIAGRGEGNIKFFDYSNSTIKFASEYRGTTQQRGGAFFPKRTMNYNKCEINRYAKLTNNTIEYVSFFVPKRNEGYDASVYNDCISGEPALGVEEWVKGENKEALRKNITTLENNWNAASEMTFEKIVEEEKKTPDNGQHDTKIAYLEKLLKESYEKVTSLQNKNEEMNSDLETKNQQLEYSNEAVKKLNQEVETKKHLYFEATAENYKLKGELVAENGKVETLAAENHKLKGELVATNEKNETLSAEVEKLRVELEAKNQISKDAEGEN